MEYRKLGSSGLDVSRVCLGTMTWGTQNTEQQGHQQIDYALDNGINFIDTAEMYSIPPDAESYGKTETIIGTWLAANPQRRKEFVLASKIAGPGLRYIRGASEISAATIKQAVDASLTRLQTDYIDLYQLHWPNRTSPHFGKHWPGMLSFTEVDGARHEAQMLDILQGLQACIDAGKIRHWGLSDDTTWGMSTYVRLADKYNLTRPVSIQNEFNLLHSKDWPYLIEQCVHDDIAYLPWSPLAAGALTGKYLSGARPDGSRWTLVQRNGLFRDTQQSRQAIQAYVEVAKEFDITPAQLALAWCHQVDGVTSTIIGATSIHQLEEDLAAFELSVTDQLQSAIVDVLQRFQLPF